MELVTLITGGAGFIGSHLADKLIMQGWHVVVLDDLSVGKLKNIDHLKGHHRFTMISCDVCDRETIVRIIKKFHVEVVYHLAAIHYLPYCAEHPYETIRTNTLGTQAVIDAAVISGAKKIIFTSTADVYAAKDRAHVEEDRTEPYTMYGISKLFAERILAIAAFLHPNLSITIARLFNVYGSRETNPHVLPTIIQQLKAGNNNVVKLGNTWTKRDFVYVEDVTQALISMLQVQESFEVFNIASGHSFSVKEVVQLLSKLLSRKIRIESDPLQVRSVERAYLTADISKVYRILGWSPMWHLKDGLQQWLSLEPIQ